MSLGEFDTIGKKQAVIPSSAGTSRSVYEISAAASDVEQAQDIVARIFCPDPDHAPPCPIPWDSMCNTETGTVHFVFYATDEQAQQILAEVRAEGLGEVRLFKSTGEDGRPIDGSIVIDQFRIEQGIAEH